MITNSEIIPEYFYSAGECFKYGQWNISGRLIKQSVKL